MSNDPLPIEWTGDLDDDCCATVGEISAHCEKLDRGMWFVSVYRGRESMFSTHEPAGKITTGSMARAVCEAIIRAYYASHKGTPMSDTLTTEELDAISRGSDALPSGDPARAPLQRILIRRRPKPTLPAERDKLREVVATFDKFADGSIAMPGQTGFCPLNGNGTVKAACGYVVEHRFGAVAARLCYPTESAYHAHLLNGKGE